MTLTDILTRSRELVARPQNDFMYSSCLDQEDALRELDHCLEKDHAGTLTAREISILFAPTGPMQELAMSSGWSDEFLLLADEFDAVVRQLDCSCENDLERNLNVVRDLGMDANFAEISVLACPICNRNWLHIFYEDESTSASGRWFECPVTDQESISVTANSALPLMRSKPWHFCGGSYFDGLTRKSSSSVSLG
ncbi:MAG TPA: hypothetical protein VK171_10400 [Fimbriimonas sp.]|nr:hypothetical protein [Fimbriimonas sp.]